MISSALLKKAQKSTKIVDNEDNDQTFARKTLQRTKFQATKDIHCQESNDNTIIE